MKKYRDHIIHEPRDFHNGNWSKTAEMVIDGGLAVCAVCGEYEAGLENPCLRAQLAEAQKRAEAAEERVRELKGEVAYKEESIVSQLEEIIRVKEISDNLALGVEELRVKLSRYADLEKAARVECDQHREGCGCTLCKRFAALIPSND